MTYEAMHRFLSPFARVALGLCVHIGVSVMDFGRAEIK